MNLIKIILILIFSYPSSILVPQNGYTKDEVDMKFELMQERINSKLDASERENKSIDAKLAAQDKQIAYQDKQIENLKFIFGILLSLIAIIVAVGSIFINNRNKERFSDLESDIKETKDDALQELKNIKDIANLEVRMAKAELNEIQVETQKIKDKLKNGDL